MGRSKGKHIHVLAEKLVEHMSGRFTEKYDDNAKAVGEMKLLPSSKKESNKLAGEVTNLMKKKNAPPKPRFKKTTSSYGSRERSFDRDR